MRRRRGIHRHARGEDLVGHTGPDLWGESLRRLPAHLGLSQKRKGIACVPKSM